MNKNDIKRLKSEGFVILCNAIPKKNIDLLQDALLAMAKEILPQHSDKNLAEISLLLEEIDHSFIYTIQKAIGTSFNALKVLSDLNLGKIHSQVYGTPACNIHMHLFQTPFQFPNDKKFDFHWHQESGSYENSADVNILTFWFPILGSVNSKLGSVEFIPKSHLNGVRKSKHEIKESGLNDWVVEPTDNEFKDRTIAELDLGDVLIFGSNLVHKSVPNISNKIRITGIARSVDICEKGVQVMATPVNVMSKEYRKVK